MDSPSTLSEARLRFQTHMITADVMGMEDVTTLHCEHPRSPLPLWVEKGKTIRIALKPSQGQALAEGLIGFMFAHPMLEHGLILWEGVQAVEDGSVIARITNTTGEDVDVRNNTPLTMWDTSDEQDFGWADTLADAISTVVNVLNTKPSRK